MSLISHNEPILELCTQVKKHWYFKSAPPGQMYSLHN